MEETVIVALRSLWVQKFRSTLTILGVVIGITTVVTVASLLAGLRKGIVDFFQEFGPDNIFIARVSGDPSESGARPRELKRKPILPEYADYLKETCRNVEDVAIAQFIRPAPGSFMRAKVRNFETERMMLQGATANLYEISPRELAAGRTFAREEERRGNRVALLGASIAEALFPDGGAVDQSVNVDGTEYRVIGVFAPAKGGFFGENGLDRQVTIPMQTARIRYPQVESVFLTAKALTGRREDAYEEIRAALRRLRRTAESAEDDFAISTADSIIANFDRIIGMVMLVSIAISGLGLLVGGIGVMNIMLVSVTERTREIGVRKALGARRSDIVLQFLSEAITLTGAGGLLGIAVAICATLLVSLAVPSLTTEVPMWAVLAGFLMSVSIGVFFGVWPAVVASRLDPVEALRYE